MDCIENPLDVLGMANQALQLMCLAGITSAMAVRNPLVSSRSSNGLDHVFTLGDRTFLATSPSLLPEEALSLEPSIVPATHIMATSSFITGQYLQQTIDRYLAADDVFSEDFLDVIIISSNYSTTLDKSAQSLIDSIGSQLLILPMSADTTSAVPPPGPLLLESDKKTVLFSKVSRLYTDIYSNFVNGIYESNGTYHTLDLVDPVWGFPLVPVPSRLYSEADSRPLAGKRIGVKDIYDMKGLKTTLGSKAWTRMTTEANATAPSIQRIIDLGGTVIGKQKTSQFASAAHAWEWTDVYYPQNPRGDGYLSCSASSAGSGCSIAAYDWLDFAIGSDTGQSMRQPAAFAGVYGNRPSQGLMDLSGVMPISYGSDTAGVFARDPRQWTEFAKIWYDPALHQSNDLNGLPRLDVPDARTFPRRILYPIDHLPLQNKAAELVLQSFLDQVKNTMGMSIEKINATKEIERVTRRPYDDLLTDLMTIWTHTLLKVVATPLLASYSPEFPPLDRPFRSSWKDFTIDAGEHTEALRRRRLDSEAWHESVLFSTEDSCSESMMIYDIGTGGLPYFREEEMNDSPGAAMPANTGTREAGSIVASYFGSADFTIPIGQVSYHSNITHREESMPVTINMVVKRGCDLVLFNFIEELANHGILKLVSTGSTAFV